MQFTAHELKEKLLRGLDTDCNVVDTQGVLAVLGTLEKFPVTKEELEQTRIGRIVNDLRRKTSHKELAKRAKNLVRKWRDFINLPATNQNGPTINGARVAPNGGRGPGDGSNIPLHLQRGPGSKPASPASGPATPSSGKASVSPPNVPLASSYSRPSTPNLHSHVSPRLSVTKPISPLVNSSIISSGNSKHSPPSLVMRSGSSREESNCEIIQSFSPHETVSKVNVANMRKRRPGPLDERPAKCQIIGDTNTVGMHMSQNNGSVQKYKKAVNGAYSREHSSKSLDTKLNASHVDSAPVLSRQVSPGSQLSLTDIEMSRQASSNERRVSMSRPDRAPSVSSDNGSDRTSMLALRTMKVKTTEELIQDLHKGGMRLSGSKAVSRIAMNQIEKEPDNIQDSVVPPEAKPRMRRKPGWIVPPPSSDKTLSKTKSEMVEKFLQSASALNDVAESPVDNNTHGLMDLIHQDNNRMDYAASSAVQVPMEEDSRSSFISVPSQPMEMDPWSLLPPLDPETIDLSPDDYEVPEPQPVTEEDVNRLSNDRWAHVNGQYDYANEWHDFTEVFSVPSAGSNLLHILPYVCLD